jgi:adenylate cyclase
MGTDEEATIAALGRARAVFRESVASHDGRVVDTAGDSVLAVFDSIIEAVRCALSVQETLATRNADVPEDRRMQFRIGVHFGDIVEQDDGTIYGDGVNIAARLEALAEPGGLTISGTVHEHVEGKLGVGLADLGEQEVKNIARPVRAYRLSTEPASAKTSAGPDTPLPLPDKPSIAVLPFDNLSGDPEQEYFADGLTEDIITELSRFQAFFVIARHSAFVYKGKPVTVHVRKAGNRVRITAQLIDATNGNHLWAERYDHDLTHMFDLQDEVTQSIVAAIPGRLASADFNRVKRKRPENMAAYDYTLRGKVHHHRCTKEDNAEALRLLDKAIELDPEFAEAYAWKSCTLGQALGRGFGDNKEELFAQDVENAEKALSLDENNIECQWIMCELHMIGGRLEQAELHHQKAIELNPNDPRIVAQRGELLTWLGRPVEGADCARRAMRLDPYDAAGRAHLLGRALYVARSYADAIEAFKQVSVPRYGHHAEIAACHAQLGSDEKARLHAQEVLRLKPDFSIADHVQGLPFKESRDREHHRDGLCKAGLPD